MKKLIYLLLLSITANAAIVWDGVIAIIDGEAVTAYEAMSFNRYIEMDLARKFRGAQLRKEIDKSRKDAIKAYINQKILINEFNDRGYQVPKSIINKRLDDLIGREAGGSRRQFIKQLQKRDETLEDVRDNIRDKVAGTMLLNMFVFSKIEVSEDEVDEYIKNKPEMFKREATTELQILFVDSKGPSKDKIKEVVAEIQKQLAAGAKFEELIEKYSDAKHLTKADGKLDPIKNSNLRKEWVETVKATKTGEISKVLKLEDRLNGYAFFKVLNRSQAGTKKADPIERKDIASFLRKQKETVALEEYMDKLRQRCMIIEKY